MKKIIHINVNFNKLCDVRSEIQATAKDLRFHSTQLLGAVKRGEEVLITYHGKPCARLIPIEDEKVETHTDLFGIWKDNDQVEHVEDYVRMIRKRRHHAD